jgi:hypothetical protein
MLISLLLGAAAQATAADVAPPAGALDAAARHAVVQELAQTVEGNYAFPAIAKQVAAQIRDKDARQAYAGANTATALADMLTADMRAVTKVLHLRVRFDPSFQVAPPRAEALGAEELAQQRERSERTAGGIHRVERLPGNVGYLELRTFEPAMFSASPINAAMTLLKNTEALILDLRKNTGGNGEAVAYLLSHFFAEGDQRHLNNLLDRQGNLTYQSWTSNAVAIHYTRPIYVLTSKRTFSAAEECAYDLQALKRATIVGEVTGGGANPGGFFPVGSGFVSFIPTGQSINPVTGANWEGAGVKPDVAIPAERALEVANARILREIVIPKTGDERARTQLTAEAERLEKGATR